jgi:TetR/AcrR family transcriptional regulator
VHWVTKWYSPQGVWSAEEAAAAVIELATRGLAAKPARTLSGKIHKAARARKEEVT